MKRRASTRIIVAACGVVALLIAVVTWTLAKSSSSGDPGGKVMDQLAPTVSALPVSVPWVGQIPQSMNSPYAVRIEPFQDSCDDIPGTHWWSSVVVQAGFTWTKGGVALSAVMNPRLATMGWAPQRQNSNPPSLAWTKTLHNGTRANVSVTRGSGSYSSHWQLDAIAKPVGKAVSGC